MAQYPLRRHSVKFTPAARASNSNVDLITVKKGDRILWAQIQRAIVSSTADTVAIRFTAATGGQADGILAATTMGGTAGDIVDCAGADMGSSGGYLCTADGFINFAYVAVGGGGTATPTVRFDFAKIPHTQDS